MEYFLILFIAFPFCLTYSEQSIYLSENYEQHLYNITTEIHYIIYPSFDNRNIELRFFFSKTNFTSNPDPFIVIYEENGSKYIDKGIVKIHKDSTKDYYIVYASHYCNSYSYKEDYSSIKFEIIPIKNISSCIITGNSVNDTSRPGKLLFFGLFFFCILISIITILKTKACGDCEKKCENTGQIQNDPIQPQTNIQSQQALIQP